MAARVRPLLLLLLLAAPAARGQAPAPAPPTPAVFPVAVITAPVVTPPGAPLVLFADQSISSAKVSWILISPKGPFETWDSEKAPGGLFLVRRPTPGTVYKVALVAYGTGQPAFAFDFADVPVGKDPPPDPGPTPQPQPQPQPQPPPAPGPGPVANLRVLLLYDSAARVTAAQRSVLFSTTTVVPYLEGHCIKAADGRAEWRFWERSIDASNAPAEWRDALAKGLADPTPLPKLVVFSGTALVRASPVTNEVDALTFLQSIGGK